MKTTAAILILMTVSLCGFSQDRVVRADVRQEAQRSRIHYGRQSGEITGREALALNHEQRHIRRSERRVEADGKVRPRERHRLEREQDRASRHIRRARHNGVARNE